MAPASWSTVNRSSGEPVRPRRRSKETISALSAAGSSHPSSDRVIARGDSSCNAGRRAGGVECRRRGMGWSASREAGGRVRLRRAAP